MGVEQMGAWTGVAERHLARDECKRIGEIAERVVAVEDGLRRLGEIVAHLRAFVPNRVWILWAHYW